MGCRHWDTGVARNTLKKALFMEPLEKDVIMSTVVLWLLWIFRLSCSLLLLRKWTRSIWTIHDCQNTCCQYLSSDLKKSWHTGQCSVEHTRIGNRGLLYWGMGSSLLNWAVSWSQQARAIRWKWRENGSLMARNCRYWNCTILSFF